MQLGLEVFLNKPPRELLNKRWGLLSNQASINRYGYYSKDLLRGKFEKHVACLFSPQHGFWGTEQDNMVETPDGRDSATGLPIFSLYSHTRRPTAAMLAGIDLLLVDLQDVGTRVYTFSTTLAYVLQEAKKYEKAVVVLDRPNPLGGGNRGRQCTANGPDFFCGRLETSYAPWLDHGGTGRAFQPGPGDRGRFVRGGHDGLDQGPVL